MKRIVLSLITLFVACVVQAQLLVPHGTIIKPTDSHIQYVGRISFKNPEKPLWTYPIEISSGFTGTSLKMMAKPKSGYFMAQIDKAEPFKVCFNAERDSLITLATALPYGVHQVKLTYIIEGYSRRPEFWGFVVDKGCHLTDAPALPERKIEFIGNSITCGFGIECYDPKARYLDETENYYYTYAARTARALEAQSIAVCRSGLGVYRNYNGPKTGNDDNMPNLYYQTLLYDESETWDFSRFTPDVVCINLGCNDTSTKPYDTKLLLQAYRNFQKQVRGHYPHAKIVWLTGVILHDQGLKDVQDALATLLKEVHSAGDSEVYTFDMTPQDGSLHIGASGHPSYWQHEKMAGELTSYLRGLMKWY